MKPVFVHIPKTGGCTIRHGYRGKLVELGRGNHSSPQYSAAVKRAMNGYGEHHGFEHARWRDMRDGLKANPCVAIVRNPWSRVASRYFFGLQVIKAGKAPKSYNFNTFDEFLEERHRWGHEPYFWHRAVRGWYPQADYVTDDHGSIRCDILRTEHLDTEAPAYFGDPFSRRRNVTRETVPYQEIYNERQIQVVAEWYATDLALFGFSFDTPAQRNCLFPWKR